MFLYGLGRILAGYTMDMMPFILFGVLGSGISLMDRAYDDALFSRRKALLLAPFMVAVWLLLAASGKGYATLLWAILFSSVVAGKVDTPAFKWSAALLVVPLALDRQGVLWPSFVILTLLGVVDEKGNDHADKNQGDGLLNLFFAHRFSMKLGVLVLALVSWLPWTAFGAIMAFDAAYDSVVVLGARLEAGGGPATSPGGGN